MGLKLKKLRILGISLEFTYSPSASLVNTGRLHEGLKSAVEIDWLIVPEKRERTNQLGRVIRTLRTLISLQFYPFHKYDVVIAHSPYIAQALALTCRIRGVPMIYDMRDDAKSIVTEQTKGTVGRMLKSPVLLAENVARKYSAAIRVVSPGMEQRLRDEGWKTRIFHIPHGISLVPINTCVTNSIRPEQFKNKFLFAYFGHFQPWQGLDNLILAFDKLQQNTSIPLGLWLVGYDPKGSYETDYRPLIEKHNIKNILIETRQPVEKIIPMMQACDALAVPLIKSSETNVCASTKFVEYCAVSKPVIATDISYIGELVDQYQCGFAAPESTPEDLFEAMSNLLNSDPGKLLDMGQNARRLAEEKFSMSKIAREFFLMLQDVVSQKLTLRSRS